MCRNVFVNFSCVPFIYKTNITGTRNRWDHKGLAMYDYTSSIFEIQTQITGETEKNLPCTSCICWYLHHWKTLHNSRQCTVSCSHARFLVLAKSAAIWLASHQVLSAEEHRKYIIIEWNAANNNIIYLNKHTNTILIISYLATFLGTNSLFVLICRKAVNQSVNQSINLMHEMQ